MLKWPLRATAAIRQLFEPLQDLDVYVEDVNDEPFYRTLLNTASSDKVKIARVFGLGGRAAVLAAASAHDHTLRRAFFIVDGDLSWVRGEASPQIFSLHQHEAYCVENLLICDRAIATILSQEANITGAEAVRRFAYPLWRTEILPSLTELFAAYATVNVFDPTYATVSNKVGLLCTSFKLDTNKVRDAKNRALAAAVAAKNQPDVDHLYNSVLARIRELHDPLLVISGKDYLLPLLGFRLSDLSCKVRKSTMRIRLASVGNLARFSELGAALMAAARRLPQLM